MGRDKTNEETQVDKFIGKTLKNVLEGAYAENGQNAFFKDDIERHWKKLRGFPATVQYAKRHGDETNKRRWGLFLEQMRYQKSSAYNEKSKKNKGKTFHTFQLQASDKHQAGLCLHCGMLMSLSTLHKNGCRCEFGNLANEIRAQLQSGFDERLTKKNVPEDLKLKTFKNQQEKAGVILADATRLAKSQMLDIATKNGDRALDTFALKFKNEV